MKLHQCSICLHVGPWTTSWNNCSSALLDDEDPKASLRVCSPECQEIADEKMGKGIIKIPAVRMRGYKTIVGKPKGYKRQPEQEVLNQIYHTQPK